jgi:hypothetical protein
MMKDKTKGAKFRAWAMPPCGTQSKETMEREGKKAEIKGWLLALALAAILTWYVINPVPRERHPAKLKDDLPGADRHAEEATLGEGSRPFDMRQVPTPTARPSSADDEDLPDWPKYIELN